MNQDHGFADFQLEAAMRAWSDKKSSSHMDTETREIIAEIKAIIARNTADAPIEPGLYRLPCGSCYVDYFIVDGTEHWLVPGDSTTYTRENIATFRHGDHRWERLYTLAEAAAQLQMLAGRDPTRVAKVARDLTVED